MLSCHVSLLDAQTCVLEDSANPVLKGDAGPAGDINSVILSYEQQSHWQELCPAQDRPRSDDAVSPA